MGRLRQTLAAVLLVSTVGLFSSNRFLWSFTGLRVHTPARQDGLPAVTSHAFTQNAPALQDLGSGRNQDSWSTRLGLGSESLQVRVEDTKDGHRLAAEGISLADNALEVSGCHQRVTVQAMALVLAGASTRVTCRTHIVRLSWGFALRATTGR